MAMNEDGVYNMDDQQRQVIDQYDPDYNGLLLNPQQDEIQFMNRNPKLYGQYPSCYMNRIPAAGK